MRNYIIRRILLMVPTIFMVTVIIFAMVRFIPGDVIDLMVAEMVKGTGEMSIQVTGEDIRHELGMDLPIHVQYGRWIAHAFKGDLGRSLWTDEFVTEALGKRLPVSAELGIIAIITGLLWALPIGTYSAIRQDTAGDYIGRTIAILAISLPGFWIATLVMVYPVIYTGWAPEIRFIPITENVARNLLQFVIPGILMGFYMSGTTMRMQRTMMLEVLRQDYIRTAWSKGLRERTVILRHALKNALIPVVSEIGTLIPVVIAGSVIMEVIFCLPGMGLYFFTALTKRDYPVISGVNLVVASSVLIINLLVDMLYAWLDPRVSYK